MSTTAVSLEPLYGSIVEGALSSLLEIDGFRILLDCGWNEKFDTALLEPLANVAATIDAVLISCPDMDHMGALPYAIAKLGLKAPIYGTIATYKFGQMLLYDAFESQRNQSDFDLFTEEDIDIAMEKLIQLKYKQRVMFHGKGEGIELMGYNGGRIVGNTCWKIFKGADVIAYAVDFGHTKDKKLLLNPCELELIHRPSALITDSINFFVSGKDEHDKFFEAVLQTLASGGDVLIPVDTSGRSLDLIYQFEVYWAQSQMYANHRGTLPREHELKRHTNSQVLFLTNVAHSTIEFAKSQLEWMNDTYSNQFCDSRINIWNLKHVQLVHSTSEIFKEGKQNKPKVILASTSSLENGFSFELFTKLAQNKQNKIIFTEKGQQDTLSNILLKKYVLNENIMGKKKKGERKVLVPDLGEKTEITDLESTETQTDQAALVDTDSMDIDDQNDMKKNLKTSDDGIITTNYYFSEDAHGDTYLTLYDHPKKIPLDGIELEAYRARKKLEREEWESKKKAEREAEALRLQEQEKLNEEKYVDHSSRIFDLWRGYDLTSEAMTKVRARGQHPMFPYVEPRTAFDDYGEAYILPSSLREEEEKLLKGRNANEEEEDAPPEEDLVPMKSVIADIVFPIRCSFSYFDLQGRCDSRTFQNCVANDVQPLQLILLRGNDENRNKIKSFFTTKLRKPIKTLLPIDNVPLDISSHRHTTQVTIEHATYKELRFFSLADYQVALVNGYIVHKTVPVKSEDEISEAEAQNQTDASKGMVLSASQDDMTPAAPVQLSSSPGHLSDYTVPMDDQKTDTGADSVQDMVKEISVLELDKTASSDREDIFVGDIKLREFKDFLDKHPRGFKTTISGAILTVNDLVMVQREGKDARSTLVVEGPMCETYFLVRSLLYSQLTNL